MGTSDNANGTIRFIRLHCKLQASPDLAGLQMKVPNIATLDLRGIRELLCLLRSLSKKGMYFHACRDMNGRWASLRD